ncbi:MAG TPA: type II toxin-antitoxin system RelE/ParE family toxin [Beijerinckiaceae bacterium]|nr:type II toxin-antitoxin system RelE/ParE family toxin [Beijerinckiaceae bacterium]HVB89234.1 type II toxin-antitoxin system RelE/ParE family toxin [Beijerinckiaceae bacterium]
MKLRYTAEAVENLTDIAVYLHKRNPLAAVKIGAEIAFTVERVGKFPFSGRAQDAPNVRKAVTLAYGYLVYYLVNEAEDAVDILAVQHPAQNREFKNA